MTQETHIPLSNGMRLVSGLLEHLRDGGEVERHVEGLPGIDDHVRQSSRVGVPAQAGVWIFRSSTCICTHRDVIKADRVGEQKGCEIVMSKRHSMMIKADLDVVLVEHDAGLGQGVNVGGRELRRAVERHVCVVGEGHITRTTFVYELRIRLSISNK